ncbi:MAG: serine/threonine-protein kinase, partial [Planctomycetota bacterium]
MPQPPEKGGRPLAQSGLADAVQSALGGSGTLPSLDTHVPRGGTIHLGAEYLSYARQKLSPTALKKELEDRLAPVVAKSAGPVIGKPFGKFVVKSLLGKGGMAEVFLATDPERDPAKGQDVALKVMRADIACEPSYIRRFLREAANAGLIDHGNVVSIHEVGAVLGHVYFTMELVQGQTLKDRLAGGPLAESDGLEVLRQIAAGLVAAHERGIGHRDLKPSNIMLADPNSKYGFELKDESPFRAKIMDFGLARMYAEDDEPEVDAEGRILGTAKYVAPELVEGRPATLQADVFSLGIMAFQIFSGRAPWKAKNKIEYLEANLRAEAPQLSAVAPGVSPETSAVVAAMLEKEPDDRPTMIGLLHDCERLIERGADRGSTPFLVPDDPESVFYSKKKKKRSAGLRSNSRLPAPNRAAVPALLILGVVVVALVLVAVLLSGTTKTDEGGETPPPPPVKPQKPQEKITPKDP